MRGYIIMAENADDLIYELITCEHCKFFRKNFRLHYMSPASDESPHACIHKNGMLHPWENEWCSYGRKKEDHE